jgi:DNA-binding response OmpR family regulator
MATNPTVLCIQRDPTQLRSLQENGYKLLTATNGCDGLRLFGSQPVDAVVLDYHLGLLDGPCVANEIKQVRPAIPIVMLADDLELPDGALNSVDALVTKSAGAHFLWATVHFVLNVKRTQKHEGGRQSRSKASSDPRGAPFSATEWSAIRAGTIRF